MKFDLTPVTSQVHFFSVIRSLVIRALDPATPTMDELEEDTRRNISSALLDKKIKAEGWTVSSSLVKRWLKKVNLHMNHYRSISVVRFQLTEVVHYLLLEDLKTTHIPTHSEQRCVVTRYKAMETEPERAEHLLLQNTEQTYGEKIDSEPCRKCGDTNVATIPIQKRSPDEPTSYYYQCRECNHTWKDV